MVKKLSSPNKHEKSISDDGQTAESSKKTIVLKCATKAACSLKLVICFALVTSLVTSYAPAR